MARLSCMRGSAGRVICKMKDGYAGIVPLAGLQPNTTYFYDLRLDEARPPVQPGYPAFTTFPYPRENQDFSFAFGSCFRPARENGGRIFHSLELHRAALETDPASKLRFILMIGDQIYSDDWDYNGLWLSNQGRKTIARTLTDYRNVYLYTWSNEHFRNLLKNLPAFIMKWMMIGAGRICTGRKPHFRSMPAPCACLRAVQPGKAP